MLNPSKFRDLVSGRRRGPLAAATRFALGLAEAPYTWAVRWRNHRYDSGAAAIHSTIGVFPVPPTVRFPTLMTGASMLNDRACSV